MASCVVTPVILSNCLGLPGDAGGVRFTPDLKYIFRLDTYYLAQLYHFTFCKRAAMRENKSSGFLTRSDTNWLVQSGNKTRDLK